MTPGTVIALLLLIVGSGIILNVFSSKWFARRLLFQLVQVFIAHNAVCINNAQTLDQLGLRPPGQAKNPEEPSDYPPALWMLIQAGIIRLADHGRLYVSQEYSSGAGSC